MELEKRYPKILEKHRGKERGGKMGREKKRGWKRRGGIKDKGEKEEEGEKEKKKNLT